MWRSVLIGGDGGTLRMAHFILTALGTDGDIFPYLGIGTCLRGRGRGHRVTVVVAEDYGQRVADLAFEFAALASREENRRLLEDPDFWHVLKGPLVGAQWGRDLLPRNFELFSDLAREPDTVFVASPALLAARVVQEKLGRPLATVVLQPWMVLSSLAPPVMPAGLTLPRWAPRPLAELYWLGFEAVGNLLLGGALNRLCEPLGLPRVKRVFRWWYSPELVLAMFPAWYGPPQEDWLPQIKLTGFPRFDGARARTPLDAELAALCDSGKKVVAFTFGTGMVHGTKLFRAAIEACRLLDVQGLLLTRHAAQLPTPLPPNVRHVPFAPFRELFPRCAAVVHHGGIGTIAEAFAAAVPQGVLPIAFDQKDNAIRVKRLGAGDWMRAGRATGPRLARLLKGLMSDEVKRRCRDVAARFAGEEPLETAADAVEALAVSESPLRRSAPASPPVP